MADTVCLDRIEHSMCEATLKANDEYSTKYLHGVLKSRMPSPVTRGTYSQTDYLKHCQHHGFTTFNPNY